MAVRTVQAAVAVGVDTLTLETVDGGVLGYRPGSAGADAARDVARLLRDARRRLQALAPELDVLGPHLYLVDPLPDPDHRGAVIADGAVVDAANGAVWLIVVPERRLDDLEVPLALLAASTMPAPAEASLLALGYALHVTGVEAELTTVPEGPLAHLEGDDRPPAALSFVRQLVADGGADAVVALMRAPADRLDEVATERFGQPLVALEDAWRSSVGADAAPVPARALLRTTRHYLRPYRRRQLEMLVLMLLSLAFTAVFPFVLERLLDRSIPSRHMASVLRLVGFLGATFVVSLVADLRRSYVAAWTTSSVVRDLRMEMFGRLQYLSNRWFSGRRQGDVMARLFDDVQAVEEGMSSIVRDGVYQLLSVLVSGVVLLMLNVPIGLVVLAGMPVVALVYRAMNGEAERRSRAVQDEIGAAMGVAGENYVAQPVVKAYRLEGRETSRFARACARLLKAELRMEFQQSIFSLAVNLVVVVLRLAVLVFGTWLIFRDRLTIGGLVAVLGVMGDVIEPVLVLTGVGQQLQAASGSMARIGEILDAVPDIRDADDAVDVPALRDRLTLQGVDFSYVPGRPVLADVDIEIPAGSRVALVGASGCGKSSILHMVLRLYEPDAGSVTIDGVDVRRVRLASLRGQLGVVYQETVLFDATIRENVALGKPDATDAEILEALRAAEMDEYVTELTDGLESPIGERGGQLSGGQRQRLAIARAILCDPAVLVLDEPTSALDPETERQINATLDRVGKGRTTLTVTHRLTSVTGYDRIYVVARGRIVESGTHEELLAAGVVYAAMWAEQTGAPVAETSVDVRAALRRIPLFAHLGDQDIEATASRLTAFELAAGQQIDENAGGLSLVVKGRGVVLGPDGDEIAVLGPGDAFGVAAAMGAPAGTRLLAAVRTSMLTLTPSALATVIAGNGTRRAVS